MVLHLANLTAKGFWESTNRESVELHPERQENVWKSFETGTDLNLIEGEKLREQVINENSSAKIQFIS